MSSKQALRIAKDLAPQVQAEARARAFEVLVQKLADDIVQAATASSDYLADQASAPPVREEQHGWYLYGLVRADGSVDLRSLEGIDQCGLSLSSAGGLSAVVSHVALATFEGLASEPITPDGRLARLAYEHDQVVGQLHRQTPVLPIRFGTVVESRSQLENLLERRSRGLLAQLDQVAGKGEWVCRLFSPATEGTVPVGDSGSAYLAAKWAEQRARRERPGREQAAANGVHRQLSSLADSVFDLDRSDGQILAAAYLVANGREPEFAQTARELQQDFQQQGTELAIAGPLPPYHFTSVELHEERHAEP